MMKIKTMLNRNVREENELAMTLLSVISIVSVVRFDEDRHDKFKESSEFTAERRIRQFEDVLNIFKVDAHDRAIEQLTDTCTLAKLLRN